LYRERERRGKGREREGGKVGERGRGRREGGGGREGERESVLFYISAVNAWNIYIFTREAVYTHKKNHKIVAICIYIRFYVKYQ